MINTIAAISYKNPAQIEIDFTYEEVTRYTDRIIDILNEIKPPSGKAPESEVLGRLRDRSLNLNPNDRTGVNPFA